MTKIETELTPFWRLLQLLWTNRKPVLWINASIAVVALIVALLLPKWYEGRVVFIVDEEADLTGSIASSVLGTAGLPGGLFGSSAPLADQYIRFLQSQSVIDKIDSLYNLQQEYDQEYRTLFYLDFLGNASFENNGDNTLTIKFYYEEDPEKAAAIANSLYEELERLVNNLRQEKNKKIRQFLERTYQQTLAQLHQAEEELSRFQIKSRLFDVPEQIRLLIQSISQLETQRITFLVEKVYMESIGMQNSNEFKGLLKRVSALEEKIESLKSSSSDTDLPLDELPEKGLEYYRLTRDVKIREEILTFVLPQLENAKVEEQRSTSNIQLLDRAAPQDYKAKPKRILVIFVVCFLAAITTVLFLLIRDFFWRNRHRLIEEINNTHDSK